MSSATLPHLASPVPLAREERRGALAKPALALLAVAALVPTVAALAGHAADPVDPTRRITAAATYLLDLAGVTTALLAIAEAATGRPSAIAMSQRNVYSLSKLQMAAWTTVVLAGLLAAAQMGALGYFGGAPGQALDLVVPPPVLAAMGIAGLTTAAVPAILNAKARQQPADGEEAAARQRVAGMNAISPDRVVTAGKVICRTCSGAATWLDFVTGDETANGGTVDLSKVQQLLVTGVLTGGYALCLLCVFTAATPWDRHLPVLSPDMVWLLAVSHAGYLVYKVAPKPAVVASAVPPAVDAAPAEPKQ